jgi:hypothetical protein
MEGIIWACPFAAIEGFHNFTVGIPKEHGQSDALRQQANCVHIRIQGQCPDHIGTRVQQFGIRILQKSYENTCFYSLIFLNYPLFGHFFNSVHGHFENLSPLVFRAFLRVDVAVDKFDFSLQLEINK